MEIFYKNRADYAAYSILLFIFLITIIGGYLLFDTFWGDSSIYLVYAKNIANLDFLSFNPGEFSSGATSPLWAFILSLGFICGDFLSFTKIISLIFTLISLLTTYYAAFIMSKSKISSSIATGFLFYFLAFPGLIGYESSFIVVLVSILIILNYKFISNNDNKFLWLMGSIWLLMPLVRPDSFIIIFLNLIILVIIIRNDKRLISLLLLTFSLSIIPSILYFGYSYLELGIFSTSSNCRTFLLKHTAQVYNEIYYWPFRLLLEIPIVLGFFVGLYGSFKVAKKDIGLSWLVFFGLTSLIIYILIFTFYSPPYDIFESKRYLLPVIPFFVIFISQGISTLLKSYPKKLFKIIFIFLLFLGLVVFPSVVIINNFLNLRESGLTFDEITEKNTIEYMNNIVEPNSTILTFEVQSRYYLREDLKILSLDGITDGKIAPYMPNGDIESFLWRYKPRYWIANEAVDLPFFSDSILGEVVNKTGKKEGSSINIGNITFKNIKTRDEPMNELWGYTQIYKLEYH